MFQSFAVSQEFVQKMVPQFVGGANYQVLDPAQVAQDCGLQWGVDRLDMLLNSFTRSFPKLNVVWGIYAKAEPNACVWGHVSPSVILLTSGAIQSIYDARARLTVPAMTFAANYAAPMNLIPFVEHENNFQALAQAGENLGLFALMGLFAHEVGHLHDRQFDRSHPIKKTVVLQQAFEVTADTWAIRKCCVLAIDWARDLTARTKAPFENALRASLFYLLVGYGFVDRIDWTEKWRLPFPNERFVHPPGALRLVACAVAIAEWLVDGEVLDEKEAAYVAVEVFGVSAQTLFWFQTGKEMPPAAFQALALLQFSNGTVVDTMRVEYERFRAALS